TIRISFLPIDTLERADDAPDAADVDRGLDASLFFQCGPDDDAVGIAVRRGVSGSDAAADQDRRVDDSANRPQTIEVGRGACLAAGEDDGVGEAALAQVPGRLLF